MSSNRKFRSAASRANVCVCEVLTQLACTLIRLRLQITQANMNYELPMANISACRYAQQVLRLRRRFHAHHARFRVKGFGFRCAGLSCTGTWPTDEY